MNARVPPLDSMMAHKLGIASGRLSRGELEAWQLERLRATVHHARTRSAFYRQQLSFMGGHAPETLADIARLPFTTADDIAAAPLDFVCVSQSLVNRIVTLDTSGTTGKPKRLFFTGADQRITLDFFRDGLRIMSGPGDRILILLPAAPEGCVGDLLQRAIREFDGQPIAGGLPSDINDAADLIRDCAPDLIIGVPIHVLSAARLLKRQGWQGTVRTVLLCSDAMPPAIALELSRLWQCEVFEDWGMTELGYGGGVDCPAHRGYHLQEADFLFEIVDPANGHPVAEGESGEIIFTTLTREGMPLIRYRTGDISRFLPGPCACGSALRRLDRIETRKTGALSLTTGPITAAALDQAMFSIDGIDDFTARISPEDPKQTLSIAVLAAPDADWPTLRVRIEETLCAMDAIDDAVADGTLRLEIEKLDRAPSITRRKRTILRERTS